MFTTVYPLAPHLRGRALRGGPLDRSQVSLGGGVVFLKGRLMLIGRANMWLFLILS